ncbi:MAG TPA: septal ring lytic transglycosylase RlpA family protein [Candidatus Saccharimonas sp.]|nr:septal ring lytic transglycosylase RlpA family protein [Candidatus Saccharimonas sp.]
MIKAKTKRAIKHLLTKKKLVSRRTSKHVLRTFAVLLATVCAGGLAYAVAFTRPVVTVSIHGTGPGGRIIYAPGTPTPTPHVPGGPDQVGKASWYALGLPQPDALTCASRTYPRRSYLQVKDLNNGKIVTCRVNDYGPEIWTGRVIDLSRGSFTQVDNLGRGVIPVEIRVVSGPSGFHLPINDQISALIGYNLCHSQHTAQYCEQHRQE